VNPPRVSDANDRVCIRGRVLYLSARPGIVQSQIEGSDLTLAECLPLRDNVSTDEITPTTVMLNYDDRLGRVAHVGLKVGDEQPIGRDAIRNGGFEVIVAGKRYGKGSSRESSPLAEKSAGIPLIVAESFERIYRQNCDNLGLFTTSDFSVLDRIAAGEAIPIEFFLRARDETTQRILRAGGLLRYSRAHLPRRSSRSARSLRFPTTAARGRWPRRSSRSARSLRRATPRLAKACSCPPTGASATTTSPACARISCTRRSATTSTSCGRSRSSRCVRRGCDGHRE